MYSKRAGLDYCMNKSSEIITFTLETPQESFGKWILLIFGGLLLYTATYILIDDYEKHYLTVLKICIPFVFVGAVIKRYTTSHYVYDLQRQILFYNYSFFNIKRTSVIAVKAHIHALIVDASTVKEEDGSIFWLYQMGLVLKNKRFFLLSSSSPSLEKINELTTRTSERMQIEAFLNPGKKFPALSFHEKNELLISYQDNENARPYEKEPLFFTLLFAFIMITIVVFLLGLAIYLAWQTWLLVFH